MAKFITFDYLNPWLPSTWSSNPLGLYSELKKQGLLVDALWLGPRKGITILAYGLACLRWPLLAKRERREYALRVVRPWFLGFVARRMIRRRLAGLPPGTCLITCSNAIIDFKGCGLPVWHYSDACLGVALRDDPAWADMNAGLRAVLLKAETAAYRRLERLLLFSQWAARSATVDHGMAPEKVSVVGHAACIPDHGTHEKLDPHGPPTILFVCTDWERKGGPLVLESFKFLRQKIPTACLVVIGYLAPEKVAGVEGVRFVGKLRKDHPEELQCFIEWYRRSDVLALASNYDPMPNISLEANLCGTPLVSTSACAIGEQLEDGVNGYLVRYDARTMAEKIEEVLCSAGRLRAGCRQYVLDRFSWPIVCNKLRMLGD